MNTEHRTPKIVTDYIECIVYFKSEEGFKFLVMKRSDYTKVYPGIWQIVTGRHEKNEMSADCAIREVREETGLNIKRFFAFPKVSSFYTYHNDKINLVPLFLAESEGMNVKLSNEHTEFKWLGYDDAYNTIFLFTQKEMLHYVNLFLNSNEYFKTLTEIKL